MGGRPLCSKADGEKIEKKKLVTPINNFKSKIPKGIQVDILKK